MTGVEGYMLVKSVRIDENFYSSPKNSPPHLEVVVVVVCSIFALCVISIALGVYIYKRKVRSKIR